jgi:hypothetical protein
VHHPDETGEAPQARREGEENVTLEQQLANGLGKTPEEVASMTSAELVQARDDLLRQIDQLNAWIAVLEAAHAVRHNP